MNLSLHRLSMDCPWRIQKVARPARLRSYGATARQKHSRATREW